MGSTESKVVQVVHSEINLTTQELVKEISIAMLMCIMVELARYFINKSNRAYAKKVIENSNFKI
jgi:hypothetical protein